LAGGFQREDVDCFWNLASFGKRTMRVFVFMAHPAKPVQDRRCPGRGHTEQTPSPNTTPQKHKQREGEVTHSRAAANPDTPPTGW
jgi:hypothetical protein